MSNNPTTIPQTRRQRVVTRSGDVLERAYVFLPASSWEALKQLCGASDRSGSQVIEMLISNANRGNLKEEINEYTNSKPN